MSKVFNTHSVRPRRQANKIARSAGRQAAEQQRRDERLARLQAHDPHFAGRLADGTRGTSGEDDAELDGVL